MQSKLKFGALGIMSLLILGACGTDSAKAEPDPLAIQLCGIMQDAIDLGLDSNMRSTVQVLNVAKQHRPDLIPQVKDKCSKALMAVEIFEALDEH